jgi:hypothetical protein
MGRLSEAINYINSEELTAEDIKYKYTHIIITEELQKLRLKYKKIQKDEKRLLLLELERL